MSLIYLPNWQLPILLFKKFSCLRDLDHFCVTGLKDRVERARHMNGPRLTRRCHWWVIEGPERSASCPAWVECLLPVQDTRLSAGSRWSPVLPKHRETKGAWTRPGPDLGRTSPRWSSALSWPLHSECTAAVLTCDPDVLSGCGSTLRKPEPHRTTECRFPAHPPEPHGTRERHFSAQPPPRSRPHCSRTSAQEVEPLPLLRRWGRCSLITDSQTAAAHAHTHTYTRKHTYFTVTHSRSDTYLYVQTLTHSYIH